MRSVIASATKQSRP